MVEMPPIVGFRDHLHFNSSSLTADKILSRNPRVEIDSILAQKIEILIKNSNWRIKLEDPNWRILSL